MELIIKLFLCVGNCWFNLEDVISKLAVGLGFTGVGLNSLFISGNDSHMISFFFVAIGEVKVNVVDKVDFTSLGSRYALDDFFGLFDGVIKSTESS